MIFIFSPLLKKDLKKDTKEKKVEKRCWFCDFICKEEFVSICQDCKEKKIGKKEKKLNFKTIYNL
jgi:hypothetical protein